MPVGPSHLLFNFDMQCLLYCFSYQKSSCTSHLYPCLQPYIGVKKYGIFCALRAATRRFEKYLEGILERYIAKRAESGVNPNIHLFCLVNLIQQQIHSLSGAEQ